LAHCVIKNEVSCQSVCAKPAVGMYEKGSVENTVYGSYFLIVFFGFGTKTCLQNLILDLVKEFGTKPFLNLCEKGLIRNHWCEIFISVFPIWFGTKPRFFRDQKRIVSCIEVKNLFRFGKKLFLFECMILNAVKRTFVKSTFKDLLSNQPMLYFLRPDTNDYVNIR